MRHALRIRLGKDHVAFQYELDGKWVELRTIERPAGFAGAPKLVAAGKSYDADDQPFGNDSHPTSGAETQSGAIDEVRIEPTPASEWKLTEAQLKAVRQPPGEPVNSLLRQGKDDPTYEQIVGYYPPFRSPREIVGVPGHAQEIGVDWLGRLDASPWAPPKAWFLVGDPAVAFGELGVPFRADCSMAICRSSRSAGRSMASSTRSRSLAGPNGSASIRRPSLMYAYCACAGRPSGPVAEAGHVRLGRRRQAAHHPDGGSRRPRRLFPEAQVAEPASAPRNRGGRVRRQVPGDREPVAARLAPASRFDVPDLRVMEAYRAWIAYSMLNADTINGHLEPHDGAGFYDSMFGNSVTLQAIAMDQYGLHDYAAKILDMQRHFQQPDGLTSRTAALSMPADSSRASEALRADRRPRLAAARHAQPPQAMRLDPPRAAGRPEGGDGSRPDQVPALQRLSRQGLQRPRQRLVRLGHGARRLGPRGRRRPRSRQARRRGRTLPQGHPRLDAGGGVPAQWHDAPADGTRHASAPQAQQVPGGDYWGLIASPLLGTDLLAPDDPRTTWIVDLMEQRGGLIAGVCEFQDGIDHAYTFGYLNNALKRDEVRKALLGFWSFMAFGMTRDTYSPVEVSMIKTGENHYTLPHLYSCTEQLRLLRNLLLREENDNVLWLGQGIPHAWLEPGKHVGVTSAPTAYGDLSYRIDANADGAMRVRLDPPTRLRSAEIRLRLRHPAGRPIASAKATPSASLEISGETITIKDPNRAVDLLVHFREK